MFCIICVHVFEFPTHGYLIASPVTELLCINVVFTMIIRNVTRQWGKDEFVIILVDWWIHLNLEVSCISFLLSSQQLQQQSSYSLENRQYHTSWRHMWPHCPEGGLKCGRKCFCPVLVLETDLQVVVMQPNSASVWHLTGNRQNVFLIISVCYLFRKGTCICLVNSNVSLNVSTKLFICNLFFPFYNIIMQGNFCMKAFMGIELLLWGIRNSRPI